MSTVVKALVSIEFWVKNSVFAAAFGNFRDVHLAAMCSLAWQNSSSPSSTSF